LIYDLHSHSTVSDGVLSPTELVARAKNKGVTHFAMTDHDTTAGLDEAKSEAQKLGLEFITGVEISVRWRDYEVHLIGLNFDKENALLQKGLESQQQARIVRWKKMQALLKAEGFENLERIDEFAGKNTPGRPHVARYLVESGYCENWSNAYSLLNVNGKFHSTLEWEYLSYAVNWIVSAGGTAVIAHPDKY
jgi:3',5'-nucleoside bisphosphate phosphatase